MKACFMHRLRDDEAQSAENFDADRDAGESRRAIGAVPLAGRKHGWNDDGAGMHGPALEGVVEIFAMRGSAVHEGRARARHRPCVADGGAGPVVVPTTERGPHVVLVAGGDAEPDDVDQEVLALFAHSSG